MYSSYWIVQRKASTLPWVKVCRVWALRHFTAWRTSDKEQHVNYADWCSPINSASKRPHHTLESAENFNDWKKSMVQRNTHKRNVKDIAKEGWFCKHRTQYSDWAKAWKFRASISSRDKIFFVFYNFSCNCSTGSFPRVKGQRREANHLPHPSVQVKKE